jgi:hypothetical protein
MDYRLDGWVQLWKGQEIYSIQISSRIHPVSYPMSTGGLFNGGKADGM